MDYLKEKWQEILDFMRKEYDVSEVAYNSWIKPLELYALEENTLYILIAPEQQAMLSYITNRYTLPIKVAVAEIIGEDYEIVFLLPEDAKKIKHTNPALNPSATLHEEVAGLNPKYVFDTFVVGNNNRFAHSASLAVAESPGEFYNPLYIYGGPGLGKTHLIQSIGHYILDQNPERRVLYVTSEEFTNEVIESIRSGNPASMTKLREKYRTVDVLMVDDIQFIIGKESTQEEFFHTFNVLHSARKQIILSSDKPPKELETLEERIKSRFEWGLIADIGIPEYETRMAILRKKQEVESVHLEDEILNYIATNIKSNVRELEGALNKLLALAKLEKKVITMETAIHELQNIISPDKPKEVTAQLIIEVVAEHFNVSLEKMISKTRSSDVAIPRQIAMYLCKEMTDTSLKAIGSLLGGRDHSTVLHGANKIAEEYKSLESTRNQIDTIKKKINPN